MTQSPAYLTLQGVSKRFGTALEDIDLSIQRGEFVCFLGPSGCGKTTLLRIVAGLEAHSGGTLVQDGRDISRLPPAQRDYGIVFQSYALFPNLSVADNVAYGLVNRRQPRAHRRPRGRAAGAGGPARQRGQVPGPDVRRPAAAGRAGPRPGHLARAAAAGRAAVRAGRHRAGAAARELRALQRRLGVTTIMVTHDQEEALSVADRIVVMNQGRIEQVGTPMQIYREPASAFVADFVGKVNRLPAIAEGERWFRSGDFRWQCPPGQGADFRSGASVWLYLRPEDRVLDGLAADHPEACEGRVRQVEFLGGNCLAEVELTGLPTPLQLQFSLNQMDEYQVREGGTLRFALRSDRLRVFPAAA
jgi:iron(III) transport system ATP-binding protein